MDRIYNGPCNGDGHGNGYDQDCCGSTAIWWLRPRMPRLNANLVAKTTTAAAQRLLGGYDHSNGYDHDCCGSTW